MYYVCVCVIPLKFCIVLFHARQILMAQPILIAPRGPHRFIPSGEGASPSPFGPLNARGCVHEPPCGGPPWPPLLPGPRKRKISLILSLILSYIPVFVVSELFFSKRFAHIPRTYVYIYACHRLCVNFVDVSHLFSRNLRRKGVSHFFSGKFPRPCAMYVRQVQAPSFFLLLTILIMVFHQRNSLRIQLCLSLIHI